MFVNEIMLKQLMAYYIAKFMMTLLLGPRANKIAAV